MSPWLMAFRMSTSLYPLPWVLISRTAVNPARRSACVFCSAMSVDVSLVMFGLGVLNMCVCPSIKPGRTVLWLRSMT